MSPPTVTLAPALAAGDEQRQAVEAGAPVALDEARQILARLERRDREDVVAAAAGPRA